MPMNSATSTMLTITQCASSPMKQVAPERQLLIPDLVPHQRQVASAPDQGNRLAGDGHQALLVAARRRILLDGAGSEFLGGAAGQAQVNVLQGGSVHGQLTRADVVVKCPAGEPVQQ